MVKIIASAFVGAMIGANNDAARAWCQNAWEWVCKAMTAKPKEETQ